MGLRCKGCGGEEHVKNGFMRGKQRYRCKACGLNFTDTPPRGMPLRVKVEAVLLYLSGVSMNRTAKLLGVSTPTVQAWIEKFAEVYAQKPEPEGRAVAVEPDEMWHYLKKLDWQSWLAVDFPGADRGGEIGDGQDGGACAGRSRAGSGADPSMLPGLRAPAALPLRQPPHGGDARRPDPAAIEDPPLREPGLPTPPQALSAGE
jgi:transposase-like protein